MLILTAGATADKIVVTLNEKKTLASPTYVFKVTHAVTKEVVSFNLGSDLSAYPTRYNEFTINTSVSFSGKTSGQWQYEIKQLADGVIVEVGKLKLNPSSAFAFTGYEPATSYTGYNG